jgi:hypothetical protein
VDILSYLESVIYKDTGTRAEVFASAAVGGLARAVELAAGSERPAVVTGFTVPTNNGLQPETDGPPGAAALAAYLSTTTTCCFVTDEPNRAVCLSALRTYDPESRVDFLVSEIGSVDVIAEQLKERTTDCIIFVERPGANESGRYLSMRGVDLTANTAPFDRLIPAGGWATIGIGDGGNEVGMGTIDSTDLSGVEFADLIHAVARTDALVVGGTSNWAAWALIAALSAIEGSALPDVLAPGLLTTCIDRILAAGAVDGISGEPDPKVDGLDLDIHQQMLASIAAAHGFGQV